MTKTDWEGTGVKPDVAVPADQALLTAHLLALQKALDKRAGDREQADGLRRIIADKEKELGALKAKSAQPRIVTQARHLRVTYPSAWVLRG